MKKTIVYHAKKHSSLITSMLVTSAVILIGICTYIIFAAPSSGYATQQAAQAPNAVASSDYDVDYPAFQVAKVDALLKDFAVKQVDDFVAKLGEKRYDPRNRMTLDYSVLHQGTRTATVVFTRHEYVINEPVVTSQKMMTFDLQKEILLTPAGIFTPDSNAGSFVGTLLYDYFKQHASAEFSSAQFADLLQLHLSDIRNVSLGDDNITLYLNPHQLDSRQDIQTIAIKKQLLAEVLKTEYVTPDPSIDGSAVPSVSYAVNVRPKPADEIDPNQRMLALTFDDGPGEYTNRVLDALKRHRARATFFVIGRQVPGRADVVRRMVAEGHEVGNHSWSHPDLPLLSSDHLQQEINDTQQAIRSATDGVAPTRMRPPRGVVDDSVRAYLQSQNLAVALWSVDTLDWLHRDTNVVYDRIMGGAADGGVILLHDIHLSSVEAVERAIPELIAQGYQLVTLEQLEYYR